MTPIKIDPYDRTITVHIDRFTYPFPPDHQAEALHFTIKTSPFTIHTPTLE